ncbi:Hypothetical predicted protein [Cloeon dipterum]|uniref:Ricin B lectin domain-containing protein n=1 Tax=Cloeon dipterum TaxID=197152 RepID=A0A8S1DBK3_9INSE|nr:Hypothetical predicted protein [Cloeon dipterum]
MTSTFFSCFASQKSNSGQGVRRSGGKEMLKMKLMPLAAIILLMVILRTNFVQADGIDNKVCSITEDGDGKSFVYLSSILSAGKYQRYSSPKKEAKWRVKPVKVAGKTYYELKNENRDRYMAGHNNKGIYGSQKPYSKSDDESTLWEIKPADTGVAVTIKNFNHGYMALPQGGGSYLRLTSGPVNKWNLKWRWKQWRQEMLKMKGMPLAAIILLMVILRTNCVQASGIENKECSITEDGDGKSFVYLNWLLLVVKYQRYSSPDDEAKWRVKPVKMGGKTYYELKNVERNKYMAGHKNKALYGTEDPYSQSDDESTLWEINPAETGVAVTIKNYKHKYFLRLPEGSSSYMRLSKQSVNKWNFKCD